MGERLYVCHKCGKRIASNEDFVVITEKHERGTDDREHVECNERHWEKQLAAEAKFGGPSTRGGH
ncbi:MAG TPA: hypothetical protein VMT58_04705 [Candidatus Binataceae bacterium]|nr:hypothetical protein [Candidatus Binataceae bacterium]